MGCGNSKNIANFPKKKQVSPGKKKSITKNDFNFSAADLVGEKRGLITRDYTIFKPPLGKGAFGEVRKAVHKVTNIPRAIKIIDKHQQSEEDQERLINEVNMLRTLDHPNIIKIYEFYQDEKYFYIVTDLCTGGELFDHIINEKMFSEKKAALIFKQLISSVYYCHQHNIVHRDLKPENLLLETKRNDSLIKVIDFGTSRQFQLNKKMHQKFGTPYYIAPEVLKRKYDEKCDIWSCGVILYILLCGYPPFNGSSDKKIMERVSQGLYNFDGFEWKCVSQEAKSFISKMLEYDPAKRYSAEQAIKDKWLIKYCDHQTNDNPVVIDALNNLRNFRAERKLQEATWVFLINYLTTKEEKNKLLKTFQSLDLNGDGQLSQEELIIGYQKIMNAAQAEEEVKIIMQQVDKNNSGAIDYTEWVMATINRENILSKEKLETAFKLFDKDGSGTISIQELKQNFGGDKIPDEIWREIINEVDDNSDGEISLKEFKDMMMKLIEDSSKIQRLAKKN